MSVLNPPLVRALSVVCRGEIRVLDVGKTLEGYYETQAGDAGVLRERLKIVHRGETYTNLDCPFCNDRRGRLAVNHRYGLLDTRTGYKGTELWKCYNEECQGNPEHRRRLWSDVSAAMVDTRTFRVRLPDVTVVERGRLPPCEFPGLAVSLVDLPTDHKAVAYVRDRDFDPAELASVWKIAYAESVPARVRGSGAQDRLICPVHLDRVMVGYQARFIGEIDWKATQVPKYLTYFPKSQTLYGIDEAEQSEVVMLCEGVTDVWRYGPGAVSPLGKSLSHDQAWLLATHLRGRTLVVAPDMDDPKSFDAFCENVRAVVDASEGSIKAGIAVIPPGMDPAKLSRPDLRSRIASAARAAVEVTK